jgi:Aspartyl/Asparaginyl beta-hydroxylase
MYPNLRLPLRFDRESLQRDLSLVAESEWFPHYNERDYGGDWRGVALRSPLGQSRHLLVHGNSFSDTELIERCPYFRGLLESFACPLKSVRLLSLAPGSFIREHSDPNLGYEDGEVRIHIPVQTNSGVEFYSSGERLHLEEGNCYYINVDLPHRVNNRGSAARVHLVIDAEVNDWVRELFGRGHPIERLAPSRIGDFRKAVLADSSLQQKLHAIAGERIFNKQMVELGHGRGFDFEEVDADQRDPLRADSPPEQPWIPVRLLDTDRPSAEWIYLGQRRFTEPFFEDTVNVALRNSFARVFRQEAPLEVSDAPPPAGIIFHISRCGSTLAAQMLAAVPQHTVISEAPIIDEAIQAHHAQALRSIVAALRRGGGPCFLKLDAWHIHNLPLVLEAFPETPWIFLYRNPLEVLVSQTQRPGRLALPGALKPDSLKLTREDMTRVPRDRWCAHVLAGLFETALAYRDLPRGLFLNYNQLPEAMWTLAAQHFALSLTGKERGLMRETALMHVKSPNTIFQPDGAEKCSQASEKCRQQAAELLNPLYRELERARNGCPAGGPKL